MKYVLLISVFLISMISFSQTVVQDTSATKNQQVNAVQNILNGSASRGIIVGGYAEIDYNQPEGDNGELDVHRLVLLFASSRRQKDCHCLLFVASFERQKDTTTGAAFERLCFDCQSRGMSWI